MHAYRLFHSLSKRKRKIINTGDIFTIPPKHNITPPKISTNTYPTARGKYTSKYLIRRRMSIQQLPLSGGSSAAAMEVLLHRFESQEK